MSELRDVARHFQIPCQHGKGWMLFSPCAGKTADWSGAFRSFLIWAKARCRPRGGMSRIKGDSSVKWCIIKSRKKLMSTVLLLSSTMNRLDLCECVLVKWSPSVGVTTPWWTPIFMLWTLKSWKTSEGRQDEESCKQQNNIVSRCGPQQFNSPQAGSPHLCSPFTPRTGKMPAAILL